MREAPRSLRWLAVTLYVGLIFSTIPWVRTWSEALVRAGYGRWAMGITGVLFALGMMVLAAGAVWRARARLRAALVPLVVALAYGVLVWYLSAVPDEVVHVAEYGVLGLLLWWSMDPDGPSGRPWSAAVLAGIVGLADELTQGVTPGRVFDWRDVVGNFLAALLPIRVGVAMSRTVPKGRGE